MDLAIVENCADMLNIARYSCVVECLEEIKLSALYDMLYIARYSGVVEWLEEITLSAFCKAYYCFGYS